MLRIESDALQVVVDAQAHEVIASELRAGQVATLGGIQLPGPGEELVGNALGGVVAIRLLVGEHMPNDNQQLVSNDGDSIVGMLAAFEFFEAPFPDGVGANGAPGDFDHGPAEFFAAFFGDGFGTPFSAALVNPWSETGIADQVLGGLKALNITDGSQDGHGGDHAKAGDLHQAHGLRSPGVLVAEGCQHCSQAVNLAFEILFGFHVHVQLEAFHFGKAVTPGHILFLETLAFGVAQMMAVREAVHAVDDFGMHLDQATALAHQLAQFANMHRRNPDFGDEIGGQEARQDKSVAFVGFGAGFGDLLDADGVSDLDIRDKMCQQVVDMPGIGGGLDDHAVFGKQVTCCPIGQLLIGDLARLQQDMAIPINSSHDGIVFVDIEGEVTGT